MGTLRYAILGLLNRKSMTGYDLSKEFQTSLAEFWHAKHSQIYPELKSLAEDGLITFQTEITGTVLEKKYILLPNPEKQNFYSGNKAKVRSSICQKMNSSCVCFFPTAFPKMPRFSC